jgi:RNA polymerase sigma-70 factor (sigma-E family)
VGVVSQPRTFEEYAQARLPALTRTAYLLTGDRSRADDLVQTALARCFVAWRRIQDPDAYVRRALVNAERSWWRLRRSHEIPSDRLPDRAGAADTAGGVVERERVLRALARLPRQQRAVIVLCYYDDLTEVAVAEVLGVSVGTVKRQRARALARLRQDAQLRSGSVEVA